VAGGQTTTLSHFEAATPFLVTALLIIIGMAVAKMVERRIIAIYERWSLDTSGNKREGIPLEFQPRALGLLTGFIVDAGQSLSLLAAPGIGLLLLGDKGLGSLAIVFYVGALLLGVLCLCYCMTTEHPDAYPRHTIGGLVTPIALIALVLNGACAAILLILGP
jgi:hypothetical protein